jgi:hypothetical protein
MKKYRTFKEPSVETSNECRKLVETRSPLIVPRCHDQHALHEEINLAFVETHTRVERPKKDAKSGKGKLAQTAPKGLDRHFFGNKAPTLKPCDL